MLAVAHVRAKFHDHVCELVEVRAGAEVLHRLVLKEIYFFVREAMHLDDFERLSIELERELKLFELAQALIETYQPLHIFSAFVALVLLQQFQVIVHLVHVKSTVRAEQHATFAVVLDVPCQPVLHASDT